MYNLTICFILLGTIESRDVTPICQKAIKILDEGSRSELRLTALKLVDSVMKEKTVRTSRADVERILAHMIVSGYLKEDFHFTPYSTISYLLPGNVAIMFILEDQLMFNCKMGLSVHTATDVYQNTFRLQY